MSDGDRGGSADVFEIVSLLSSILTSVKGIIAYLFKIIGYFCGCQVSAAHKREVVVLI